MIITGAVESIEASDSSSTAGGGVPASPHRPVDAGEPGADDESPPPEGGEEEEPPQQPSARLWLSRDALEQLRRGMWWRGLGTANPTDRDAGGCCILRGAGRAGV